SRLSTGADLTYDGWVLDLVVVGEQEGFAQDDREERVALEGKHHPLGLAYVARWHDAEVGGVRLHLDVGTAEVDAIRAQLAVHNEEAILECAAITDSQARDEAGERFPARARGLGQAAERILLPVAIVVAGWSARRPVG